MNENRNTTYQNLWEIFIVNAYVEKINNLTFCFKKVEEKSKPKAGKKKEIIKICGEINKREQKNNIEKSMQMKVLQNVPPRLSSLYLDWPIKKER